MSNISLICHSCKCECSLVKFTDEDFTSPWYMNDYYRSDCCHDYVEDSHGRIYWACELSREYEEQQSWEVSEDDLLQR